ncbi:heme-binding protein [Mycolicibacterium septicum]|uniref:heme-binding protein n=1 Tax=Mycolicibacterium septicum TaxID=98668 RepID=UPI0023E09095|nr:heme-binding protein [Mycolicibacterium septicum]MDF3339138.1 heme-binding protein [Mycolicibacterium septicum]
MNRVTQSLTRATVVLLGAGAMAIGASATAAAEPPNCTTADVTAVMGDVSSNMSGYLFTHPDVNAFFTGLQGQAKSAAAEQTKTYLNNNPQVRSELDAIRRPAIDLRNRCNIPLEAQISGVI